MGDLFFKDNASAFDYACKYLTTEIVKRNGLIALVVGDKSTDLNGNILYALKVSSHDGGFVVPAVFIDNECAKRNLSMPVVGDLVAWIPAKYSDEIGELLGDHRKGWTGFIAAKCKPILRNDAGWKIAVNYM